MRRHIPKECKEIAICMSLSGGVSDKLIRRYTGISQRVMKRLRKTFRETGEVVQTLLDVGRPRLIDSLDAAVSHLSSLLFCFPGLIHCTSSLRVVSSGNPICHCLSCKTIYGRSVMSLCRQTRFLEHCTDVVSQEKGSVRTF